MIISNQLKLFSIFAVLLTGATSSWAQPAHDNPCGAINLPVVQSADPPAPERVSFNGATYTAYSISGTNTCGPSFATDPDVWYRFTATGTTAKLNFLPSQGGNPGCNIFYGVSAVEFVVLTGNCTGPFILFSCGRSDIESGLTLRNLVVGTVYYIKISTGFGYSCGTLGCSVYTNFPSEASRVGINTSNPQTNLDVAGNVIFRNQVNIGESLNLSGPLNVSSTLSLGSTLGNRLAVWGNPSGSHYGIGMQSGLMQLYSDGVSSNIAFGSGNSSNFTERARVINNGEVAFQTNGRISVRTGSQAAGIWFTNSANSANVGLVGLPNNNVIGLFGNAGAGWGLTMNANNGYVGIGLNGAVAQVPLQFSNTLGLTKISLYRGTYGDVGIGVYGGELRLQNDIPHGKVSMGVLETNGNYTELAKAERSSGFVFSILGNLWVNGTSYASDQRFKKNIEPLQNALDKVLQLQGVSYQMKDEEFPEAHFETAKQVGLLAQDVEKIVPEVVSEGPNGYKAIDYAKLVPLLIESIKQQQQEIEALKMVIGKKGKIKK